MNFIVAVDNNYAIGKNNDLLYDIPRDMKYFRETTLNKIVVMGLNTLLSFPNQKPLKNRTNIVLSGSDKNFKCDNAIVVYTLDELFDTLSKYNTDDIFVVGGASVYNLLMPYCKYAYITKINAERPADVYINNIEKIDNWNLIKDSEKYIENDLEFSFQIYENKDVKQYK